MRLVFPKSVSLPLAALALLCALLAALPVLPARWMMLALPDNAMLALADADGTVWRGSGQLALGPPGARRLLSEPVSWQWRNGALEVSHAWLRGPVRVRPGLTGVRVSGQNLRMPATALASFGAPLNTVAPGGQIEVQWQAFTPGQLPAAGTLAEARWTQASSALSHVKPLGNYLLRISGGDEGVKLALSTESGVLSASGEGQWQRGRLRFRGTAEPSANASDDQRAALTGLLSALGPVSDGKSHFGTPP
ncbi:type II secretion system protein N [Bordetella petrii]|uniref:type II secretion system protein N n=1 Tax=Bordetella petrii TaxID=94624 RepID=UPI001E598A4D|nr:type II secretion system protein N [Bordetella petrii]MCD0505512.1 type II secretion system protein N [Bordetella petrii]